MWLFGKMSIIYYLIREKIHNMARQIQQQTFIDLCNEKHNFKYDYSKVVYVGCDDKITIICPVHGEFDQRAYNHKRGIGCPLCARKPATKPIKVAKSTTAPKQIIVPKIQLNSQQSNNTKQEVVDFVKQLTNHPIIIDDDKLIKDQVIDIFIPAFHLAIDVECIYWNGELQGYGKQHYKQKTNKCNSKLVQLLHIWDIEWHTKPDIVKSRIKNLLLQNTVVYARKCQVKELQSKEVRDFLSENHLQGAISSSINFGLFYKDELVAVMTFSSSRFNKNVQYELLRFCVKNNFSIIGGAGKLHNAFLKQYKPTSVISYCDLRYGTGNLYKQLGYQYSHVSDPNYFYFKRDNPVTLHSRQTFQKHKLPDRLDIFDESLTEWQNMVINNYDRIWDCGNSTWIWKNN